MLQRVRDALFTTSIYLVTYFIKSTLVHKDIINTEELWKESICDLRTNKCSLNLC